jgi:serine protease Do
VIVRADGVVLTNNHVVEDATEITVTLSDGRNFPATILGTDPRTDLAVLQLEGVTDLSPLSFGDSTGLRLGEMVLAIGNPFGLEGTVTMGIVSAKGRADVGIVDYEDFIQTDAAINPGNSGGALVNTRGELVGINTAILSRSGGYQGIGFAIPSDMAKSIMESLLANGEVARGWLGVLIQDLKPELAEAFDITTTSGALIADITEGSPAAKAGLKRGDIIIAVGKRQVETSGDLRNRIGMNPPGTRVKITLIRKGRKKSLPVQLGELPNTAKPNESETSFENDAGPLAGVELAPLGKERRRELGAEFKLGLGKDTPSGLVVLDLPAAGLAARGGLRAGDIILEANRRPIRSEQDLRGATRDDPGHLLLLVHRDGATIYLVLAG